MIKTIYGALALTAVATIALAHAFEAEPATVSGRVHYVEPILIPANANGQFYITVRIDGIPITALVDTGASTLVLSSEDAEKVGIDVKNLRFTTTTNTANGTAPRATLLLHEVNIGGIVLRDIKSSCCALGGKSLLGMTALSRLNVQINRGTMFVASESLTFTTRRTLQMTNLKLDSIDRRLLTALDEASS